MIMMVWQMASNMVETRCEIGGKMASDEGVMSAQMALMMVMMVWQMACNMAEMLCKTGGEMARDEGV